MSFVEMTNEEWEAVYKHHDALIHMAELELQVEQVRATSAEAGQSQLLEPIETRMHDLDGMGAGLPA